MPHKMLETAWVRNVSKFKETKKGLGPKMYFSFFPTRFSLSPPRTHCWKHFWKIQDIEGPWNQKPEKFRHKSLWPSVLLLTRKLSNFFICIRFKSFFLQIHFHSEVGTAPKNGLQPQTSLSSPGLQSYSLSSLSPVPTSASIDDLMYSFITRLVIRKNRFRKNLQTYANQRRLLLHN